MERVGRLAPRETAGPFRVEHASMVPGQPEHIGDAIVFLQPDEHEPGQVTLGLWGPEKTVQMPYGLLRTRLCRPSELGVDGFDALFTDSPLPMARRIPPVAIDRLCAALRARAEQSAPERGVP